MNTQWWKDNNSNGRKALSTGGDIACIVFLVYVLAYYPLSPQLNFFPQFNNFVQCKANMESFAVLTSCKYGFQCMPAPLYTDNYTLPKLNYSSELNAST